MSSWLDRECNGDQLWARRLPPTTLAYAHLCQRCARATYEGPAPVCLLGERKKYVTLEIVQVWFDYILLMLLKYIVNADCMDTKQRSLHPQHANTLTALRRPPYKWSSPDRNNGQLQERHTSTINSSTPLKPFTIYLSPTS